MNRLCMIDPDVLAGFHVPLALAGGTGPRIRVKLCRKNG